MGHEVTVDTDGFAKISYAPGVDVWHRLGRTWPDTLRKLPTEAFEETRLRQTFVKAPYVVMLPDGSQVKSEGYALVKMPYAGDVDGKPVVLGTVSESYEALDNMKTAASLDSLAEHLPLQVVGSLRNDTIIFATFKANELDILCNGKPDHVDLFLLFLENKLPGHGVVFNLSGICTVCMNTVEGALSATRMNVQLGHTTGAQDRVEWTAQVLKAVAAKQAALGTAMQQLANKPIGKVEADRIFNYAAPMPEKPVLLQLAEAEPGKFPAEDVALRRRRWERETDLMSSYFRAFQNAYDGKVADEGRAGTAWGAYNAVTYVTDHVHVGQRDMGVEARAESAVVGKRRDIKLRAWAAATKVDSL